MSSVTRLRAKRGELSVIVRAGDILVAIPTRWVRRLLLADEVRILQVGTPGLVDADGEVHVSWDLGVILGVGELAHAWVLLELPVGSGAERLRIALNTGPCILIEEMPAPVRLPPGIIGGRGSAVTGIFRARADHGGPLFGLALDPPGLFSPAEIEACVRLTEELAR